MCGQSKLEGIFFLLWPFGGTTVESVGHALRKGKILKITCACACALMFCLVSSLGVSINYRDVFVCIAECIGEKFDDASWCDVKVDILG
ncbi:hypothetical protein B0T18DRAFT_408484 [Schizothecium vesticola]|uniref:Uncharacterized protein n=1 Tax=Schizothecium vesticola TaxID=314040 RepID=A0AA40K8R5_9PEZI|nr:hypothetical protein B0T18DRAFT_408484 [Schizothecium vesticola]